MKESERSLLQASQQRNSPEARAATWVTSDFHLLEIWRIRHEHLMQPVAQDVRRFGQPTRLRAAGVLLAERSAFIDYLRTHEVPAPMRDRMLARLRNSRNSSRALLDEHQDYLLAVCSTVCVEHLLVHVGDSIGARMLQRYRALNIENFASTALNLLAADGPMSMTRGQPALAPEVRRLKQVLTDHPA